MPNAFTLSTTQALTVQIHNTSLFTVLLHNLYPDARPMTGHFYVAKWEVLQAEHDIMRPNHYINSVQELFHDLLVTIQNADTEYFLFIYVPERSS